MTMDVVLPSPDFKPFKPDILGNNGKIDPRVEIRPYLNGYGSRRRSQEQKIQKTHPHRFSLNPACTCLLMFDGAFRYSCIVIRTFFVAVNNLYCIPTYTLWMLLLLPLRVIKPDWYWRVEGRLFHWLLSMVSLWSDSAGYRILESGDDIDDVTEEETLVLANHQSTSDVPLLMAAFNTRSRLLPNLTWIMDYVFKFTNFGVVSSIHGDFFVVAGKNSRERTLSELSEYLQSVFVPRKRKWIVLFPEGGFLHKRREVSQRYAEKNNLPHLHHVTIPRMGAVQTILDGIGPKSSKNTVDGFDNQIPEVPGRLKYILDITIAYPNGQPLDIIAVVSGYLKPCNVHIHYRLYPINKVPQDPDEFQDWLMKRYEEKEMMLEHYYETGDWKPFFDKPKLGSGDFWKKFKNAGINRVEQDLLRMALVHSFFILSTLVHWLVLKRLYLDFLVTLF